MNESRIAPEKVTSVAAPKTQIKATQNTPVPASLLSEADIENLFGCLQKSHPHPETELFYTNHYTLLVAIMLSARATDAGVNKATPALFSLADSPQKMIALGIEELRSYIRTIGLFPTKAKNILAMSHILSTAYDGKVPDRREDLEALPGVGRKTANVLLNVAFGQPTLPVDTHVFRVANRTGLAVGKNVKQVEEGLEQHIPEKFKLHAHHWLILHGRYVCKARKPLCSQCAIAAFCLFGEKELLTKT